MTQDSNSLVAGERAPTPDGPSLSVGIVGAGLAGLSAARVLVDRGHEATVFDKGRGPGGRASTRRAAPFAFDHGAQYFTARSASFVSLVETWIAEGVVARWQGRIVALRGGETRPAGTGTTRYVGTPGMNAVAKRLARGLDVRTGVRVATVEREAGRWALRDDAGEDLGAFDRLVVTAPPAQTATLLRGASPLASAVEDVVVRPCIAVLLGLVEPWAVDFDGAFCDESALSWIARDSSKPGRPSGEAWVLHAAPDWSEANFGPEHEPAALVEALVREVERVTRAKLPALVHRDVQRWRYALPDPALEVDCLVDHEAGLALAGDALCGGRVEGAFRSGVAAAEALLSPSPGRSTH